MDYIGVVVNKSKFNYLELDETGKNLAGSKLYRFYFKKIHKDPIIVRRFTIPDDYIYKSVLIRLKLVNIDHWYYVEKRKKYLIVPDDILLDSVDTIPKKNELYKDKDFVYSLYQNMSLSLLLNTKFFMTRLFHVKVDDVNKVIDLNLIYDRNKKISTKSMEKIDLTHYNLKDYLDGIFLILFPNASNEEEILELLYDIFKPDWRVGKLRETYINLLL